jgi:hypothetical protein
MSIKNLFMCCAISNKHVYISKFEEFHFVQKNNVNIKQVSANV